MWDTFTSMTKLPSSYETASPPYEKNIDLKLTRETHATRKRVEIFADTIESLSNTTHNAIAIVNQLPLQEKVQGLMETWPMEKSKVLIKA